MRLRLAFAAFVLAGLALPEVRVKRIVTLTGNGGRVDWSPTDDLLVFDSKDADGYFNIYTMRPDGSAVRCLTCGVSALPSKHKGNPAFSPSGDYIVFQAERDVQTGGRRFGRRRIPERLERKVDFFAAPGAGFQNDLWLMDQQGRRFWKLYDSDPRVGGVLHPHFSPRGDKLLWAERVASGGGRMGQWALKIADFSVVGGTPRVSNIRTLRPGSKRRFYESHGFSPDGRQIVFTADPERGDNENSYDVFVYDLSTGKLKNLTDSPGEWDEHAQFSPDGRKIVWMSSRALPLPTRPADLKTDLWIMNPDGSDKQRLTYFNDPNSPEYIPRGVAAADVSWSPDGSRIVAYVIEDPIQGKGRLVRIDLDRQV